MTQEEEKNLEEIAAGATLILVEIAHTYPLIYQLTIDLTYTAVNSSDKTILTFKEEEIKKYCEMQEEMGISGMVEKETNKKEMQTEGYDGDGVET